MEEVREMLEQEKVAETPQLESDDMVRAELSDDDQLKEEDVDADENGATPEEERQLSEEDRAAFIEDWNERNAEYGKIRDEAPTKEEVEAVKEEYGRRLKVYNETTFEVADKENAVRVASFLKKWNEEDVQWENNMWQGTIMFDMIVKKFLEDCREEPKAFVVNWQTLVYLYLGLRNMKGTGLKSAVHMQKINDEYCPILDTVGDMVTEYNKIGSVLQKYQEKWRLFEQGYYITINGEDDYEYFFSRNEGEPFQIEQIKSEDETPVDGEEQA